MKFNFNSYDNSKQSISYCEVDKCKAVIELKEQLDKKEQECERTKERLESFQKDYSKLYQVVENKGYIKELDQLKETNDGLLKVQYKLADSNKKLRQTIEKIKGICEFDFTMSKTNLLAKSILQICDEVNNVK